MKRRTLEAADLFCGGGGFSTGLLDAARSLGYDVNLLAVNCWEVAIGTHSLNHPGVRHLCQRLEVVSPREVVPSGKLDLLVASPECTHFSTARGGKPMSDQKRSSAWRLLEWLDALDVECVIMENVSEFQTWGPLYPCLCGLEDAIRSVGGDVSAIKHRPGFKCYTPIEKFKGKYFRNFLRNLRALGYRVDHRVLNAADYGAATTRRRLFLMARKGRKPIHWPEPTHAPRTDTKQQSLDLGSTRQPWRPAREIIDWTIAGESIYTRKKPLAPNTLARIYAGLRKFCGVPFLLPNEGYFRGNAARGLDEPCPTITQNGVGALVHPFLVVLRGTSESSLQSTARSLDEPAPAVLGSTHMYLAEPFLVGIAHRGGNGSYVYPLDRPSPTVTTQAEIAIAEPYLVAVNHGPDERVMDLDNPLRTLTGKGTQALIQPFVIGQQSGAAPRSVSDPAPTVAGAGAISLVEPYLVDFYGERAGQSPRCRSIEEPMPTVAGTRTHGLCQPFLVRYNGTGDAASVEQPVPTITARDRFALVHPELVESGAVAGPVVGYLDIRFRMLQPHELAAAMSFPRSYVFNGTREQKVKQIGNAVDCRQAKALCLAALGGAV